MQQVSKGQYVNYQIKATCMKNYRRGADGFGISWGVPGLRIGRSQYGSWWIMVGLPFGFRFTKRLGKMRNPFSQKLSEESKNSNQGIVREAEPATTQRTPSQPLTKNQEILERIKRRG